MPRFSRRKMLKLIAGITPKKRPPRIAPVKYTPEQQAAAMERARKSIKANPERRKAAVRKYALTQTGSVTGFIQPNRMIGLDMATVYEDVRTVMARDGAEADSSAVSYQALSFAGRTAVSAKELFEAVSVSRRGQTPQSRAKVMALVVQTVFNALAAAVAMGINPTMGWIEFVWGKKTDTEPKFVEAIYATDGTPRDAGDGDSLQEPHA